MQFFIFKNCHSCIIEFPFSDLHVFHGIMGTFSWEAILIYCLPPSSMRVYSKRKEFAPQGANSFFESKTLLGGASSIREANRKSQKLFSLLK